MNKPMLLFFYSHTVHSALLAHWLAHSSTPVEPLALLSYRVFKPAGSLDYDEKKMDKVFIY